ncbi:MAG: DUF2461 family protein [Eubacterium sp.]|nr:DUF2461 family protein [Eubacterium sp.]
MKQFKGFDKETNKFLFELQFCNTIEKQGENLVKYKKYITEPINMMYLDLLDTISRFDIDFETKPARCISTPYTDRRFSPTVPLKEYMYLRFRQANRKTDMFGLYFDMGCEAYGFGMKIYKATSKSMDLLREKISNNAECFSKLIDELVDKGFEICGEKYKKDHFPNLPECSAKELLNRKTFSISKCKSADENVYTERLETELSAAFLDLKQFIELLAK